MADVNFQSINVDVFPTTYRTKYLQGKYTSEENFVNILNSLTDNNSYVLSWENQVLKVVIHGYYFEIRQFTGSNLPSNLWLGIKIESGESNSNALVSFLTSSTTLDENDLFTGLYYVQSSTQPNISLSPAEASNYTIYWLRVTDASGNINPYRVRFDADSIKYSEGVNVRDEFSTILNTLETKQDDLSAGDGLDLTNNTMSIKSSEMLKLNSLPGKGTALKPVYFNSSGQAVASNGNVGLSWAAMSGGYRSQWIYMQDGTLKSGTTMYASVSSPDDSVGNNGDIWIKYS